MAVPLLGHDCRFHCNNIIMINTSETEYIFVLLPPYHIIRIWFIFHKTIGLKQVAVCKFAICVKNLLSLKGMKGDLGNYSVSDQNMYGRLAFFLQFKLYSSSQCDKTLFTRKLCNFL